MTCVDVMYQPFTSAFPAYPRPTCSGDYGSASQSFSRMQEPLDLGPSSSTPGYHHHHTSPLLSPASSGPPSGSSVASPTTTSPHRLLPSSTITSSTLLMAKHDPNHHTHHHTASSNSNNNSNSSTTTSHSLPSNSANLGEREATPKSAHYVSAKCVVYTYFTGDAASVVDDHFTRTLNQSGNYESSDSLTSKSHSKVPTPMTSRNFPPSFWNSAYQHPPQPTYPHFLGHPGNQSAQTLGSGGAGSSSADGGSMGPFSTGGAHHYLSGALHGFSNLQTDPWAYGFPSTTPTMPYPHRPMAYDFSYPTTSRFSQNYSSFLMQPTAMRSAQFGAVAGHCDVSKGSDRARYGDHRLNTDYTAHHSSFSAIDAAAGLQEAAKDLYWF